MIWKKTGNVFVNPTTEKIPRILEKLKTWRYLKIYKEIVKNSVGF